MVLYPYIYPAICDINNERFNSYDTGKIMMGIFCINLILLVAVHAQNEYDTVVLKDCYSYENMEKFLSMGTLEQIRCLQQYMLTLNNGIIQHKLNDLFRIPVSMTYSRNGGKQMLDILPMIERKIYNLRPGMFKHLTGLIKNPVKRSKRHTLKSGQTRYPLSDIVPISHSPILGDLFPIPWKN
ncbi:Hypothetical predicted protein [Mytilus galloprovincialis]|uniref:Uncharacterized protein n=1 Tax=Mytilus galloprovincialis TaxID=29158 RepID=A0A8B6FM35_MYTGA|nr:Hypothetical predicted protein [Mytilus galloprovincialis]